VGGVTVRIPGVPEFVVGERALVFLRVRSDGTLGTSALSLAKYTIDRTSGTARRAAPTRDERPLAAFGAHIRALAGAAASASVADGFGGPHAVDVNVYVDGFTLLSNGPDCDPTLEICEGARWFEARCGRDIVYSMSGVDPTHGETGSRQAFADGLAAWSGVAGSQLNLVAGPDAPTVPSSLAPTSLADLDSLNVVQYDDPFDIVPALSGCQGVLALGGTVSTSSIRVIEGDTTFDRTLEGDVVVNDGAGTCLSASGLAETVAHEIGHTLGFGHSSEDPAEPDPTLTDALMYFLVHDDGRGATLGTDDVAAAAFSYAPPAPEPSPEGEALRDVACLLATELWASACFLDQEELGGFPASPLRRFAKAGKLAGKAYTAPKAKKRLKLLKKTDRLLAKAESKLAALETRGTLSPECAGTLRDSIAADRMRVAEAQVLVGSAL